MTDAQKLALIDPALEPWQKCEHKYVPLIHTEGRKYQLGWKCSKCGKQFTCGAGRPTQEELQMTRTEIPTFGDGKTRYDSEGDLLDLCDRLGGRCTVEMLGGGAVVVTCYRIDPFKSRRTACRAGAPRERRIAMLREAILCVFGEAVK